MQCNDRTKFHVAYKPRFAYLNGDLEENAA
jgi:hypothetical protein